MNDFFFSSPIYFPSRYRIFTTLTSRRKIHFIDPRIFSKWFSSRLFFANNLLPLSPFSVDSFRCDARKSHLELHWGALFAFAIERRTKRKNGFPLNLSNCHKNCLSLLRSPIYPAHSTVNASLKSYASIGRETRRHFLQFTAQKIKNSFAFHYRLPVNDLFVASSDFFTTGWKIFFNGKAKRKEKSFLFVKIDRH